MQPRANKTRIALAGFGPFPKMPENPSARLVRALQRSLAARSELCLKTCIFPTEWRAVRSRAQGFLQAARPDIVLLFGVCRTASTIRIERSAFNAASGLDATGAVPPSPAIRPRGAERLDTQLSVAALAKHVRGEGIAALPSLSAGRYLCNYLYYLSLAWAARQPKPPLTLFVHIPPTRAEAGFYSDAEMLRGAEALLQHLMSEGAKPAAAPPAEKVA
jgi:pyroglutamyl-peptidase